LATLSRNRTPRWGWKAKWRLPNIPLPRAATCGGRRGARPCAGGLIHLPRAGTPTRVQSLARSPHPVVFPASPSPSPCTCGFMTIRRFPHSPFSNRPACTEDSASAALSCCATPATPALFLTSAHMARVMARPSVGLAAVAPLLGAPTAAPTAPLAGPAATTDALATPASCVRLGHMPAVANPTATPGPDAPPARWGFASRGPATGAHHAAAAAEAALPAVTTAPLPARDGAAYADDEDGGFDIPVDPSLMPGRGRPASSVPALAPTPVAHSCGTDEEDDFEIPVDPTLRAAASATAAAHPAAAVPATAPAATSPGAAALVETDSPQSAHSTGSGTSARRGGGARLSIGSTLSLSPDDPASAVADSRPRRRPAPRAPTAVPRPLPPTAAPDTAAGTAVSSAAMSPTGSPESGTSLADTSDPTTPFLPSPSPSPPPSPLAQQATLPGVEPATAPAEAPVDADAVRARHLAKALAAAPTEREAGLIDCRPLKG